MRANSLFRKEVPPEASSKPLPDPNKVDTCKFSGLRIRDRVVEEGTVQEICEALSSASLCHCIRHGALHPQCTPCLCGYMTLTDFCCAWMLVLLPLPLGMDIACCNQPISVVSDDIESRIVCRHRAPRCQAFPALFPARECVRGRCRDGCS
jgi:hypothetical protein